MSQQIQTPDIPQNQDPLLLRTARGEKVERVPVWMMRQAGRHMKAYRDLCQKHKTFRERSENADIATEISLQPWRAYGTDGCILFSDILTPLPAMGVSFDIAEKEGPVLPRLTSMADVEKISPLQPQKYVPFVAEALKNLRHEVGQAATVLGFVGLPYTLATYLVEGASSSEYKQVKRFSYEQAPVFHAMLSRLAENIGEYAQFQIEAGAQVIQLFDSWAGNLSPEDYDTFAAPYQRRVIETIKKRYPKVPLIMYIHKSGALLERMASTGVDIVSLDWTVNLLEAKKRFSAIGKPHIGIQGNLDPMVLFAPNEVIKTKTETILRAGEGQRHIMNLGHGIDASTSEEKAQFFINTVKSFRL
jgi:uroporphyrinogen decarboxylase